MLKRFADIGGIDARGVPITAALLSQIIARAPRDAEDHPTFTTANFGRVTFRGNARLDGVTFQGKAEFYMAAFKGSVWCYRATFKGDAWFGLARV